MLSKVVGRGDAAHIRPLVFPDLAGYAPAPALRDTRQPAQPGGQGIRDNSGNGPDSAAALQQKLREQEARAAAERREAFEAGRQQGEQQARADLQPVLERLNASIAQVLDLRSDLRARAERDAVKLALLIAQRVLHRQLSVDESALTALARVAFERLTRTESYRITVHPRFAAAVAAAIPPNHAPRVQIEPDPACAPGTLVVHSSEGVMDASVDTQIEEISRGLADRISRT